MNLRQIAVLVLVIGAVIIHAAVSFLTSNQSTGVTLPEASELAVFKSFILTQFAWVVSYAALIAFAVFQALPQSKQSKLLDDCWPWISLAMVAQMMWIVCGYLRLLHISLGVAALGLAAASGLYYFLAVGRPALAIFTNQQRGFIYLPMSMFLGWSIFNFVEMIVSTLNFYGIQQIWGDNAWWVMGLVIFTALVACFFLLQTQDIPLAAIILWGLFGVYLENFRDNRVAAGFFIGLLVILMCGGVAIYQWWQLRKTLVNPNDYFS